MSETYGKKLGLLLRWPKTKAATPKNDSVAQHHVDEIAAIFRSAHEEAAQQDDSERMTWRRRFAVSMAAAVILSITTFSSTSSMLNYERQARILEAAFVPQKAAAAPVANVTWWEINGRQFAINVPY